MKHLKHLFTAMLLLCTTFATAHDFEVDGIYYNITDETSRTVEVTSGTDKYTGSVFIPSSVTYNGTTYSVTSIGNYAFYSCTGLTSIEIPNSVTSIGSDAFSGCSGLTRVTIPNSVTSIGEGAFYKCSGLTIVTIGNSVTSIGNHAFRYCSGLTIVTIGNSVTSIGERAFYGCSGLTSVTIPNSVTSIGSEAFSNCSGLTSIIVENGNSVYDSRNNCNAIIVTATNTLIVGCKNTIIPNSVTSIGEGAFSICGLTSVTIPNSVTSIGSDAFYNCVGLKEIYVKAKTPPTVESDAFYSVPTASATLYVPIGTKAAYQAADGWNDFGNIVESDFNSFKADGIFYNTTDAVNKTVEVTYRGTSYDEYSNEYTGSVVIPSSVTYNGTTYSVTSIGSRAFENCSGLTSVTIPNSVTSIGSRAFCCCSGLTSIEIPNSVTSIGEEAFYWCSGLTSVTIPNSVTSIGSRAFSRCSGLTSIEIPNSVTSIGEEAFYWCSGLTSITIPNSVISIGDCAFRYCDDLTSVTIPNSVTSIGEGAFYYCRSLTSVTIGDGVKNIEDNAFYDCSGLKEIYVKAKTPPTVESDAFYNVPTASATLYVPYGTKSAYQAADVWKNFANIVETKQVEPATEVTINVDESGYATYCSEYALDFSEIEDVKVYAATGYKSDTQVVTLARVMTTAAETGIFIKGEPGEYVVPVIDECSEHSLNLFVGTFVETTVNSTSGGKYNFNFKVNNDDSAPMFYPFEDSTIFGANKAYLQIPSEWLDTNASKSISIMFDDEEANGLKGDINGDGRVSVTDIQSVVNIILNVE